MAGTNKVEDLKDPSCTKGICATSPGWIIVEFNGSYDFEEIEVAGWGGNSGIWASSNGASSRILVSDNKNDWIDVGALPSNLTHTKSIVKLTQKCSAKYIKFVGTSYLGLGYLEIKTES